MVVVVVMVMVEGGSRVRVGVCGEGRGWRLWGEAAARDCLFRAALFQAAGGNAAKDNNQTCLYVCHWSFYTARLNNNKITLKGTIGNVYNLLTAPRTVSNMHAQVAWAQSCANHMQHIWCSSCATSCVPRGTTDSSPINNNNKNNNDFISKALFHVKHAQLRCTMPMNNTHTHTRARASKTSYERTIAYKSLKHNNMLKHLRKKLSLLSLTELN